jgi:hypothetical protein
VGRWRFGVRSSSPPPSASLPVTFCKNPDENLCARPDSAVFSWSFTGVNRGRGENGLRACQRS